MLGLAFANRFWLVPALTSGASEAKTAAQRLRRHVFAEQVLGFLVILIVSVLGTLEPAIDNSLQFYN
jgi:putative copper resistance protein D